LPLSTGWNFRPERHEWRLVPMVHSYLTGNLQWAILPQVLPWCCQCCFPPFKCLLWFMRLIFFETNLMYIYIYIYEYIYMSIYIYKACMSCKIKKMRGKTWQWTNAVDSHWQGTNPTSRQRGRPTETRQQFSDRINIWLQAPQWAQWARRTDWLTVRRKVIFALILTDSSQIKKRRQEMKLVEALWVKCCCEKGRVWETRKRNVRRLESVPED
jgi:hypothetical protein